MSELISSIDSTAACQAKGKKLSMYFAVCYGIFDLKFSKMLCGVILNEFSKNFQKK